MAYDDNKYDKKLNGRKLGLAAVIVAAVFLFIGACTLFTSCGTVDQDKIGFQVGGGPFDPAKNKVKSGIIEPGRHILGTMDDLWQFPAYRTLRYQDFKVRVSTYDGKRADLDGQLQFRFIGEKNPKLAKEFATGIGARPYGGHRPGEDNEGWSNMLDQLMSPSIYSTAKKEFGAVYCADFEPSCRSIDPRKDVPPANPEAVYDRVGTAIQQRLTLKLGAPYFVQVRFQINKITLPDDVQKNIDAVTAEQAKTKAAQQSEQTAKAEANAIRIKGKALKVNPKLIGLEEAKVCAASSNCTTIIDGSGNASATVPVGK